MASLNDGEDLNWASSGSEASDNESEDEIRANFEFDFGQIEAVEDDDEDEEIERVQEEPLLQDEVEGPQMIREVTTGSNSCETVHR